MGIGKKGLILNKLLNHGDRCRDNVCLNNLEIIKYFRNMNYYQSILTFKISNTRKRIFVISVQIFGGYQ